MRIVAFSTHEETGGFLGASHKPSSYGGTDDPEHSRWCARSSMVFRREFSDLVRILPIHAPIVFVDVEAVVSVFNAIWEQFILLIIKFTSVDALADR